MRTLVIIGMVIFMTAGVALWVSGRENNARFAQVSKFESDAIPVRSLAQPRLLAAANEVLGESSSQSKAAQLGLVLELQRELRRVGCYTGEVSGEWGTQSRRALHDFVSHVDATLSMAEPDSILLVLVRGYVGNACDGSQQAELRAVQRLQQEAGRPPPSPIVTGGLVAPRPPPPVNGNEVIVVPLGPTAPPDGQPLDEGPQIAGRMAVGGPAIDEQRDLPVAEHKPHRSGSGRASGNPKPHRSTRRRDTSWTGTFYNQ